jgi:hypothetical protein
MKKITFILTAVLLSGCSGVSVEDYKSDVPARPAFEDRVVEQEIPESVEGTTEDTVKEHLLPKEVNNAVPFFAQAPDGDWSQPWEDACEEASLALAYHYVQGTDLSVERFKREVLEMVAWEESHFGFYKDTTVAQTVRILEEYYAFGNYEILENPSVDDLKKVLAAGKVIVAPFAGRMLGNPFYSGEGPYYHMLVIRGYEEDHFITNDVGTRQGENFIYSYETVMNALHDFRAQDIETTPARVIVMSFY